MLGHRQESQANTAALRVDHQYTSQGGCNPHNKTGLSPELLNRGMVHQGSEKCSAEIRVWL